MKRLSLLVAALAFVLGACERHSWEDVKNDEGEVTERGVKHLYEEHGKHGGDHDKEGGKHGGEGKKEGGNHGGGKPAEGEKNAGE